MFTSQGCSSCPPADKLAADLARTPGAVVLSLPVDYWDYLGWKDTYAAAAFTARQKAYGNTRGDREVYTPQAVVNGTRHVVGSDRRSIEAAASQSSLGVPVTLSPGSAGARVDVGGGSSGSQSSGSVWLVPVLRSGTVAIGRGENSGETVTYVNVARAVIRLGGWNGAPVSFDIPAAQLKVNGADGYVVILQAGEKDRPGAILGAAQGS